MGEINGINGHNGNHQESLEQLGDINEAVEPMLEDRPVLVIRRVRGLAMSLRQWSLALFCYGAQCIEIIGNSIPMTKYVCI